MFLFLSIYPLGLLFFIIHFFNQPKEQRNKSSFIELFLLYLIVFGIGITSLVAFIGLTFLDDYVAQFTNWPRCPFEQQLANVNLGYGILGIMGIWFRRYFWLATVVGFSVWIFGDGIHHFYHYIVHDNDSDGNIGVPLYTDVIIPVLLFIFYYLYYKTKPFES